MSDAALETVKTDPAASSLPNNAELNAANGAHSEAPVESEPANDASVKPEAVKTEASDDAPAAEDIAKEPNVKTEGHANGVKKEDSEDAKLSTKLEGDEDAKATIKAEEGNESKKYSSRRYADDDPRNKFRTSGLKHRGNKFDPSVQDITDDPVAIRKQVEFYFSDSNLARDKFLYDQVEGTKNKPIPIKTIHSFKRMRRFQPYEAVLKALKESEILEVTDDENISRKTPLSTDFENKTLQEIQKVVEDKSMARSVYVKGFGMEEPSTQFDLEAWFGRFGETNAVRLRRADDKSFKGSVFVEFADEETAQKFLDQEPKPTYKERELLVMSKKLYCDEKVQQIRDGKIQPNTKPERRRDDRNSDRDWRERRDEDRKRGFGEGRGRGRGRGGRGRGNDRRGGRNDRRDRDDRRDRNGENKKRPREGDGEDRGSAKKEKLEKED